MASFFKSFGKGILYLLALPFVLVGLCVGAVICFFIFIVMGIKELFLFFYGGKLFKELPEDIKAREIIQKKIDNLTAEQPQAQSQVQQPQQPNTITINIPVETLKQQYQQSRSPIELMQEERMNQEIQYQEPQQINQESPYQNNEVNDQSFEPSYMKQDNNEVNDIEGGFNDEYNE